MKLLKQISETIAKLILGMVFIFIVLLLFLYLFNNPQTFITTFMVGLSFIGFYYTGDWFYTAIKHIFKKEPNE